MLGKRGYFFILDAFIADTIIFVSLAAMLSSNVVEQRSRDYSQAESYASFITDTRIDDLNNQYVQNLTAQGIIKNTKNSIIEQIDQFYYDAYYACNQANTTCINQSLGYSLQMIKNISEPLITERYGFNYIIRDIQRNISLYSRDLSSLNGSDYVLVAKRISFLYINQTTMLRPHVVEISIWTR